MQNVVHSSSAEKQRNGVKHEVRAQPSQSGPGQTPTSATTTSTTKAQLLVSNINQSQPAGKANSATLNIRTVLQNSGKTLASHKARKVLISQSSVVGAGQEPGLSARLGGGDPIPEFSSPTFASDSDDDVSEVESFSIEPSDLCEDVLDGRFLLSHSGSLPVSETELQRIDPETQARIEALLEAAGIGKLSADGKRFGDPEVLSRLTSSVSCALDEAAAALTRMRTDASGAGPSVGLTSTSSSSSSTAATHPSESSSGRSDDDTVRFGSSVGGAAGSCSSSSSASAALPRRSLAEACNEGDVHAVRRLLDEGRSVHETTEEGESLLSLACSAGYYELAQVLLAMRANVEDKGLKQDCTPLMEAASAGNVDIVRLLIDHNADVNAQSASGNTPLMYACASGHEEVVRLLLEAGANVEDHNENGHTPLMEAASAGHVGVARILLEHGAGINTHSNEFKESALTLACYKGHLEMVRFLLEAGADQEHKTDEMHTALMEASMDGHVEVARLLLDSGAQVNMPADSFESPLTLAACGGHVELAMLLLERGANIEEVNDEGYTPLMEAAREGHEEMVALLLSQGADINAQTEETQETALTLACCGGFLEVADFLIKAGADLELGASTPLMEAAQEGHLELVRYLLEAGASVLAQTGTGDTALTYAAENGHTDVTELLLQYGADLEHVSEGGRTPLMKAARAGHLCAVQFLLSKGADVNRQTSSNDHTPLSLACAGGHVAVVELLLLHGANPFHRLKDNSTMIIEAAKSGHTQVVQLLLDYPNSILVSSESAQFALGIQATQAAAAAGVTANGPEDAAYLGMAPLAPIPAPRVPPHGRLEPQGAAPPTPASTAAGTLPTITLGGKSEGTLAKSGGGATTAATVTATQAATSTSADRRSLANKSKLEQPFVTAEVQQTRNSPDEVTTEEEEEEDDLEEELKLVEPPPSPTSSISSTASTVKREAENKVSLGVSPFKLSLPRLGLEEFSEKSQCAEELEFIERELREKTEKAGGGLSAFSSLHSGTGTTINLEDIVKMFGENLSEQPKVDIKAVADLVASATLGTLPAPPVSTGTSALGLMRESVIVTNPNIVPTSALSLITTQLTTAIATSSSSSSSASAGAAVSSVATVSTATTTPTTTSIPLPPADRPKAKPVSKKDNKNVKKQQQWQVALQQQNQQLEQLQQLQQLNQHLQQQVLQQRQLKQQNQATLAALQQNAIQNQVQLAALQQNVAQLQQLEQQVLAPALAGAAAASSSSSTGTGSRGTTTTTTAATTQGVNQATASAAATAQFQQRVQQILQQKQQLQQQIRQFQLQVEQQLAFPQSGTLPPLVGRLDRGPEEGSCSTSDAAALEAIIQPLEDMKLTTDTPSTSSRAEKRSIDLTEETPQLSTATETTQQQQMPFLSPDAVGMLSYPPHLSCPSYSTAAQTTAALQLHYQQLQAAAAGLQSMSQQATAGTGVGGAAGSSVAASQANQALQQQQLTLHHQLLLQSRQMLQGQTIPLFDSNLPIQSSSYPPGSFALPQASQQAVPATTAPSVAPPAPVSPEKKVTKGGKKGVKGQQGTTVSAATSSVSVSSTSTAVQTSVPHLLQQPAQTATNLYPGLSLDGSGSGLAANFSCNGAPPPHASYFPVTSSSASASNVTIPDMLAAAAYPAHYPTHPHPLLHSHGQATEDGLMVATPAAALQDTYSQYLAANGVSALPMAGTGGVAGGAVSVPDLPDYSLPLGYLTTGAPTQVAVPVPVAVVPSGHSAHPGATQSAATGPHGHAPSGPNTPRDLDSETESNHDTALTLACTGGHEELVELLLSRGADIEHRDKKGFTPLILAATAGHEKVCEILLTHGANIEAQSERTKDTPLSLACSGGRFEVVDLLLNRGANKEHRNVSDYTPLSLAASGGYVNIIRLLLAHGAEINSRTGSKLGISPLMLAAMNGHVTAVRTLLDMGSDINAQIETNRNTALTLACFQGRHEVVQLLLEKKANVEHRAKTGLTPLMEAASGGYVEVGRVLLEYGADVNAPPVPSSRDTALTIAADKGHVEFVDLLLKHGAQEDVKNKKGNSPLWLAANGGHLEVVELLYKANADIDSQDNRKVSCLMAAFRKGHIKVVKWMVKRVTQFPSDQEMTRYITTITDKELLKKCHHCLEIIRTAKDHQAAEANKNATNLLEELDMEKIRQDMKRQAAARRREKKKKKKAEKKEEKKKDDDGDDDDEERKEEENEDQEAEENSDVDVNDVADLLRNNQHGMKGLKHRMHEDTNGNVDSLSHVSSSEGKHALPSPSAPASSNNNSKKKNKKNESAKEEKEKKPNGILIAPLVEPPSAAGSPPTPTATRNSSKRKKETISSSSSLSSTASQTTTQDSSTSKIAKNGNRTVHDGFTVLDTLKEVSTSAVVALASPKRGAKREEGWTVVRKQPPTRDPTNATVTTKKVSASDKSALTLSVIQNGERSKKVSVPASAISRVIGRAGCNINAIREISGAHIEVEKQGKNTGDRSVLIKGTAESTKQAQTLIAALIKEPDKEFAELLAKYRSQAGSSQNQAALSSAITAKAARAVAGAVISTSSNVTASQAKALATAVPATTSAWGVAPGSPKKAPLGPGLSGTVTPPLIPAVSVASLAGITKSPAVRQLFPTEGGKKASGATKAAAVPVTSTGTISTATTTMTSTSTARPVPVASSATSTATTITLSPSAQTSQSFAAKVTESVGPTIAKKSTSSGPASSAVGAGSGPTLSTSMPTSLTGLSRPAPLPSAPGAVGTSVNAASSATNPPSKPVPVPSSVGTSLASSLGTSTIITPVGVPVSVVSTALSSSSVSVVGSMSSSGSSQGGMGSRPGSTSPVQEYSPFNNLFSKSQPNIWPKDQGNKSNSFASVAAGPLANQAHGGASRTQLLSDVAPVEAPPTVDLAKAPGYRGNLQQFSHGGDAFAHPSSSQANQEVSMTSSAPGTPVPSTGQARPHPPRPHPLTPPPRIGSPLPLFNPAPIVPPHQRDRSTPPGPPSSMMGHSGPAAANLAPGGPTSTRLGMNFGPAEGLNTNQFEGIPFPPMFRTQAPPPPPRFPGPHHRYAGNQGLFSAMPYQSKLNPNAPDFSSSRGPGGAGGGFPGPNPGVIGNRMPFPSMFSLGMATGPVDPVAGMVAGHHPSNHAHQPFGTDFPPPIGTPFAAPPSNPDLHRMMNFPPRLPPTSMTLLNAPPPSSAQISPRPATNPDSPSAVPNTSEHLSHPPPSQPHPRPIGDDRDRKLPRPIGTERAQSRRTPAFQEMAMWGSSGGQNANTGSSGANAVGNTAGNFGDVMHQPLGQHPLGPNDWMLGGAGGSGGGLQGPAAAPGGPVGEDALMFLHKQSHQQQMLQRHLDAMPNVEQNIDVTYQNGGHFGPSGHGFLNGLPPQMLPMGNVFGNGLDVPPPENGLWMTGKQRADQSSHESPTMWGKWTQ